MPRYIDADALIQKIDEGNKSLLTSALAMTVIKMVDDIPTADVVEVVRCKDCKWWHRIETSTHGKCGSGLDCKIWKENQYCSYGKRKEVKSC